MSKKQPEDLKAKIVPFRLSSEELKAIEALEEKYNISRSELIRRFLFNNKSIVNLKDFLETLKQLAAEQGRVNNNINQLARHANQFSKVSDLNPSILFEFNKLMIKHLDIQNDLNENFSKIYAKLA